MPNLKMLGTTALNKFLYPGPFKAFTLHMYKTTLSKRGTEKLASRLYLTGGSFDHRLSHGPYLGNVDVIIS